MNYKYKVQEFFRHVGGYMLITLITAPFAVLTAFHFPYEFLRRKNLKERDDSFIERVRSLDTIDFYFAYAQYPTKRMKSEAKQRRISHFLLAVTAVMLILPFLSWPMWMDIIAFNDEPDEFDALYFKDSWFQGLYCWIIFSIAVAFSFFLITRK